ncbi:MAG: DUF4058 family protein [Chloroflexaceae bacterium]|nr:DUF4058 family protein [Chloroflexaceae bacterium]
MRSPLPGMDPYLEQATIWPDVHLRLIAASCDAIQAQLQPEYIAVITPYVTLESIEIAPTRQTFVPDIGVLHDDASASSTTSVAIAPPPLTLPVSMTIPTRYARIEIRSVTHNTLITSIELLSPANKRPDADGADAYEAKRQKIFQSNAHLIEIDILRGGIRPRLARPLPVASYFVLLSRSYRRPLVDVWPIGLRDALPVIPIPLAYPDPDVALDLNHMLHQVYHNARYERRIDYGAEPPPPAFAAEDAAWLDMQLKAAGVR